MSFGNVSSAEDIVKTIGEYTSECKYTQNSTSSTPLTSNHSALAMLTMCIDTLAREIVRMKQKDFITVTTNESGECVLVSRQDEDHKILKVIWEKK